jgi:hypothetical protein
MSDRRPPFVRARTIVAVVAATAAALVASTAGFAAPGAPPGAARDLAQTYFSTTLTRAEVVSVVARVVHDYRIDEGRVTAVRPNAIDLLERDGTRQTIALAASTQVMGFGRSSGLPSFLRGARVIAIRDGAGPATQIRPSGSGRVLSKVFFTDSLVRAEVLTYAAKTLHDYRLDEGRIVSVRPGSITLQERDGTRQQIAVSPSTLVTLAGQPADLSAVTRGLAAITIREGDGPALEIRLFPGFLAGRR